MSVTHAAEAPRVSVIVPAHNAAATLAETLASLTAQTLPAIEVLVVDDASTDGTRDVAARQAAADPRFRLLAFAANRGVAEARNAGLEAARGLWVLFLDADDWIEPGHLASLLAAAEADPAALGAFSGYRYAREDGRPGEAIRPRLEGDLFAIMAQRCPLKIHACLVQREAVLAVGGFDPGLEVAEDWDLWQRLARVGGRFVPAEGAGAIYRLRPASASHRSSRHLADHLEVLRRAHAPDPRVPAPSPENAAGRPADELPRNRAFLLLVVLGGRLGQGSDVREVVEAFEPGDLYLVEPDLIAERLDWGFQPGAACLPEGLPALWSAREPQITAALDALAAGIGEPALGPALVLALARRFVHRLEAKALPLTIGPVHAVRLNDRDGFADAVLPPGASVLRVYLGNGRRAVELPAEDGRVTAGALVRAALTVRGREMARRALRDAWRGRGLRRLAREAVRPRGRQFAVHLAGLPRAERRDALDAFVSDLLPSLRPELKAGRRRPATKAAPSPATGQGDARARWESFYARESPWGYESAYEQAKYAHTLEVLPPGRPRHALELACAEGHFTVHLARRVDNLLATDISTVALGRAAERCRSLRDVRFAPLDLARDPLPGRFDLIVASEVFYYLKDRRELARVARRIVDALEPGGLFLNTHPCVVVDDPSSAGFDWPVGFGAVTINALFATFPELEAVRELRTPLYRVALFRKRAAPARASVAPEIVEREPVWPDDPARAGRVCRDGAALTLRDARGTLVTRRLPILMYHRIASDGPASLATWRVHPERFEAQLDWLKRHGFQSVGLDAWAKAAEHRFGVLPGRAVCVTFDDGYEDFAATAWPLLRRYGFGAHMFLVADLVGGVAEWDAAEGPPAPLMDWATIERLGREGVTFGCHTCSHPRLTRVGPERMIGELRRSKGLLEDRLGAEMSSFAYPFGSVDSLARNAVDATGFTTAVTIREGLARYGDDPLLLPRVKVAGETDLEAFARSLGPPEPAPLLRRLRHARARRLGAAA